MLTSRNPSFQIKTVMIFNPTLKPLQQKPLEQQIQQAKIIFYYPQSTSLHQKRNHVGLAEGIFQFFDFLCIEDLQQNQQIISTNRQLLIIKQCEVNIWVMLGLKKIYQYMYTKEKTKYMCKQFHNYEHEQFEEKVCTNIINHFYNSFKMFYGRISNLVRERDKIPKFVQLMSQFISRYTLLNQNQSNKKMDLGYYLYGGIKLTSIDQNSMLKCNYLNSILKNNDAGIRETIIFNNGNLTFSSLDPQTTLFLLNYFYGTGESFKLDELKINKKFVNLKSFTELKKQRFGYFVNSKYYGYAREKKIEIKQQQEKKEIQKFVQPQICVNLIEIILTVDHKQKSYRMNTYLEDKFLFITFSENQPKPISKIQYQNMLFRDHTPKLAQKNSNSLFSFNFQIESNRFIYLNLINLSGRITMSSSNIDEYNTHLRFIINHLYKNKQKFVLLQIGMNFLYGFRHLNRILIVQLSTDLGMDKIEDYLDGLAKNYFPFIYI